MKCLVPVDRRRRRPRRENDNFAYAILVGRFRRLPANFRRTVSGIGYSNIIIRIRWPFVVAREPRNEQNDGKQSARDSEKPKKKIK